MPRSREPPPTSIAAIGENPVRARHAASVWRRSRANGVELGDDDVVDLLPRLRRSPARPADATKPSACFARSASPQRSRQCCAIASVTCLPARAMLRLNTALPLATTTTSVRSWPMSITATGPSARACASDGVRSTSRDRGAAAREHAARIEAALHAELRSAARRDRGASRTSARACPRRAARPGRASHLGGTGARRRRRDGIGSKQ